MSINQDNLGFEFIPNSKPTDKNIKNDKAIEFSKKILEILQAKVKSHNSENIKKVTFAQVKKVYRNTASDKDFNKIALAKVNMFLRMVSGMSAFAGTNSILSKAVNNKYIIEASFNPTIQDLSTAEEDIKNYKLEDFDFNSHEELYLEDEEDRVTIYGLNNNI